MVFSGVFSLWGGRGSGEEVTLDILSMEEFIMREENFHDGAQDFLALLKNKQLENK